MTTKRMTGKDYRKENLELIVKQNALNAQVSARLLELCKQHPDAIISRMGDTDIKAKSIGSINYIKTIELTAQIMCIEKIEEWLASQSPFKQTKIKF
jgi:hypothetical protein